MLRRSSSVLGEITSVALVRLEVVARLSRKSHLNTHRIQNPVMRHMRSETLERERLERRRIVEERVARTLQKLCRGRIARKEYQMRLRALALQRERERLVEAVILAQRLARGFLYRRLHARLVAEKRAELVRMEAAVGVVNARGTLPG